MLENIPGYLKTYSDNAKKALDLYNGQVDTARKRYQPAPLQAEKSRLGVEYRQQVNEQKEATWKACKKVLDDVQQKIKGVIARPLPSDFGVKLATLQAIKNVSRAEADALLGEDLPYMAYRAACDTVNTPDHIVYRPIALADVTAAFSDLNNFLDSVVNHSETGTYRFQLACKGNIFQDYDSLFSAFTDGAFDEAGRYLNSVQNHSLANIR